MIVSTRGRYALRVLIDLAEHNSEDKIPLKDISSRQGISQKYMEAIMTVLSKNNLVEAAHGKGGGYKLNRSPQDYKIGEILKITEGSMASVACLEEGAQECPRHSICRTVPMWTKLDSLINDYLNSISIADLMKKD